jgi:hypothetical protein
LRTRRACITQFRPLALRAEPETVADDDRLQLGVGQHGDDGILEGTVYLHQLVDEGIIDPAQAPDIVAQLLVACRVRRR